MCTHTYMKVVPGYCYCYIHECVHMYCYWATATVLHLLHMYLLLRRCAMYYIHVLHVPGYHASHNMMPFCQPSNKLIVIQGIEHLRGLRQDSIFPVSLSPMYCMLHHSNLFLFLRTSFPSPFAATVPTCTNTARSAIAVRCDRLRAFCSTQLGKNGSQIITSL